MDLPKMERIAKNQWERFRMDEHYQIEQMVKSSSKGLILWLHFFYWYPNCEPCQHQFTSAKVHLSRGCKTPVGFMIFMRLSYTIQYHWRSSESMSWEIQTSMGREFDESRVGLERSGFIPSTIIISPKHLPNLGRQILNLWLPHLSQVRMPHAVASLVQSWLWTRRRAACQVYIFQRPMHDTIGLLLSTEEMDAGS